MTRLVEPAEPAAIDAEPASAGLGLRTEAPDDRVVVVAVTGEIDLGSAPLLRVRLAEVIPAAGQRLVVDLSATTFLDSTALKVFVGAYRQLRRQGAELVLRAPNPVARRVLEVTGLDKVFAIEDRPLLAD